MHAAKSDTSNSPQFSRPVLIRRGLHLEYITLAWDLLEAAVAVAAGILSGSVALIGFGLDSAIEMSSGAILIWRLTSDTGEVEREVVERQALRLVGVTLFIVAAYISAEAIRSLVASQAAHVSIVGMAVAVASLIVMPLLARAKRRVAAQINSRALVADSRQADVCTWLSVILLVGLALNAIFGWWWVDSVAALSMVPFIANEGLKSMRGERCC